jgi:hypothetical protein
MRVKLLLSSFLCLSMSLCAAAKPLTVVKVPEAKYNASAKLKITSPAVLKNKSPILVLVSNFPIGVDLKSQGLDDLNVPLSPSGSRVLLVFSNGKRLYVSKDNVNLLLTQRSYFNKRFRVSVSDSIYNSIRDTNFVLSSMLVNCYGETIKNENAFYSDVYCYTQEHKGIRDLKSAMKKPYLVYNEPYGTVKNGGILLDFYVKNAILSPNEHNVDLYIDDHKIARLRRWSPYVIQNLPSGKHTIRLELIDPSGSIIKNVVTKNSTTIYVK